jgi:hypothetical protein
MDCRRALLQSRALAFSAWTDRRLTRYDYSVELRKTDETGGHRGNARGGKANAHRRL